MNIIIDSTVLRRDYYLSAPDGRLLVEFIKRTNSSLVVSVIVLDEVCNLFREDLTETSEKLASKYRQLLRREPDNNALDIDAECKRYRTATEDHLKKSCRARFLPYPTNCSHEQIVSRALQRRKPFNSSGKGYRDTLIWLSIIEYLGSHGDSTCLITANTKDFWNPEESDLHHDLQEDLKSAGIKSRLRVFRDVSAFAKEVVAPTLATLQSALTQLREGTFEGLDLVELLNSEKREIHRYLNERGLIRLVRDAVGHVEVEEVNFV